MQFNTKYRQCGTKWAYNSGRGKEKEEDGDCVQLYPTRNCRIYHVMDTEQQKNHYRHWTLPGMGHEASISDDIADFLPTGVVLSLMVEGAGVAIGMPVALVLALGTEEVRLLKHDRFDLTSLIQFHGQCDLDGDLSRCWVLWHDLTMFDTIQVEDIGKVEW